MNHQTNQNNADPSCNPTDKFGFARSEYPGQVCSCVVAKHANGFEAKDPSCVGTDGEVQSPRPFERVAQYHAN